MVAELAALGAAILCVLAEIIHSIRVRRVAELAFGPTRRPAVWAMAAPLLRVLAVSALVWGMTTLMLVQPKVHQAEVVQEGEYKHIVMVLDVSPSMRLQDAGKEKDKSRMRRAREVMESFFQRVAIEQFRVSVVATYTDAKNVVIDTKDLEVIRKYLGRSTNALRVHVRPDRHFCWSTISVRNREALEPKEYDIDSGQRRRHGSIYRDAETAGID